MFSRLKNFYSKLSIRGKINITVIGAAGVILIFIMSILLLRTQSNAKENAEQYAKEVCTENAAWACDYVDEQIGSLHSTALCFESQQVLGSQRFEVYKRMIDRIVKEDTLIYAAWYIEDSSGNDSTSVHKYAAGSGITGSPDELLTLVEKDAGYSSARQNGELIVSDPISIGGKWAVGITMPVKANGAVTGAVGYLLKSDLFDRIVNEAMQTKGIVCKIISYNGFIAAHYDRKKVGQKLNEDGQTDEILDCIKKGKEHMNFSYSTTLGEDAYKVYTPIDFSGTKCQWSFCTNVPKSSFTHKTYMIALLGLVLMLVGLALLTIATNVISRLISAPIVAASTELKLISEGRLSEAQHISVSSKDEIGEMVDGLNNLSASLKHLAYFAHEVGTGNLDAAIKEKSEHDVIGKAMVEMKQNLTAARNAEIERKRSDEIQRWKVEGNARIHETIRKENASIKQLCDAFLHEAITYSKAIQGGIFIINDDQESEKHLELVSCVAYNRKKMMAKRMELDEGMIGRCIYEKAPIILTEIPQDYLSITSGLGDRRPDFLAIIPLVSNDEVIGAIELASFDTKEPYVMEYLEKTAESLASAISSVKINERTQKLLEQSKLFAEEMSSQEEELRQNMEEMQAAQEEMHRKTEEYEETILSLKAQISES